MTSCGEKQNYLGDPINTYTGNYNYETTDLSISIVGQPLRFERTYNSLPVTGTVIYDRPLGYGWTHNYDLNLTLPDDPGGEPDTVILKAPHGSRMRFTANPDGTYTPYPGVWAEMTRQGVTAPYTYIITAANQTHYTFGLLTDTMVVEPLQSTPALSLTLSPDYNVAAAPGTVLTLTHILTNTSGVTDTYAISASSAGNWVTVEPVTATLAPSSTVAVTALVTAPTSYGREAVVTATLTAASQTTPILTATAVETLTLRGYRLLASHDPQGNETQFSYDSQGFLDRVSDPTGQRYLEFGYDPQDRLTSVTDHAGRSEGYSYDLDNNLTVYTDTRSLEWTYTYTTAGGAPDAPHYLHEVVDPDGHIVEKTYFDADGRAIRQEDGLGQPVAEIDYTSATERVVTEAGKVYTDTYNSQGLLVGQTDALGQAQNYTFDDSFNRNYVKDGNQNETYYERDEMGLTHAITQTVDGQPIITRFTYDPVTNNLESTTDARGYTTTYDYDAQNNLTQVINPSQVGGTTVYTYNTRGQVTEVEDERGNKTYYSYDPVTGDRTSVTDALGNTTTYEYDALGRVITTTGPATPWNPAGKVTVNEYDAADNLVKVTENAHPTITDPHYQDEYNLITLYAYNGAGRRTVITDTVGRETRSFYDAAGRLESTLQHAVDTDLDGDYEDEGYDLDFPDRNIVTTYGYDSYDRQVLVTDTLGFVTFTAYDAAARVDFTLVNAVDTNSNGYADEVFNPAVPDQNIKTKYEYDANGNVIRTIELAGSSEERATCTNYDALNRVERTVVNCTNDPLGPYSDEPDEDIVTRYEYDAIGNQREVYAPLDDHPTTYDYDALNRVITMTNPAGYMTSYGYDLAGNRTRVTDAEVHSTYYEYDALNRVVTTTNHLDGQNIVRYDAAGNRTYTIDAKQRVTTYTYDSLYRLSEVTNAEQESITYQYDALGNKRFETDAENTTTRYQYDDLNRLTITTRHYVEGGPSNSDTNIQTVVSYDGLGRRTRVLDGRDNPTQYGYDGLGRTTVITDALDHATHIGYDGFGNRLSVTNSEGETTEFQYDGVNRLVQTIDPLNQTTVYTYNQAGERTGLADAENVVTRYEYDDLSRLTVVTENYVEGAPGDNQTNVTTRYGYDRVGNRTVITDARGNETSYVYDALNRRIELYDPLSPSNITYYGYDAVGNRTIITDANGVETTFSYDNVNRLTDIDYSDSTPDVSFTYDNVGNRETMSDSVTGQTVYDYDGLYRLTDVTDGAGFQIGYSYDEVGNRTSLTYPNNHGSVTYEYDDGNRLITTTNWLNGQFGYNYDDANRLTGLTLPNGVSSDYAYDDAGRLLLLTHDTLTDTLAGYSYELDNVGNRRVLTESLVTVQQIAAGTYLENEGQVVMEGEHGQRTSGLTHDWLLLTNQPGYTGTSYLQAVPDIDTLIPTAAITTSPRVDYVINFTTPSSGSGQGSVTYTVWLRGYPTNAASDSAYVGVGDDLVEVTGFAPGQWTWASQTTAGVTATLSLTATGVQTVSLWMREDGLRIDRLLLTTDTTFIPAGEGPPETERQLSAGGLTVPLTRTIVYTYDNLYRLTEADYSTGENYEYSYDPVGNRLQQIINGDTIDYLYDAANRLAQLNGQAVYSFDANGNLLQSDVLTNTFDGANRLTASTRDDVTVQPIYNGVNDRVGQTVGLTTTYFALDVAGGLPEVIYTTAGEAYLHLPGVIMTESSNGEVRYLLSDGLGSIRQAVDEAGEVVASYEFDPYGNPIDNTGGDPYGYTGEWYEGYIGLLHLRARWLMAETGTFLSRDPVESEPPYLYVRGNPVNRIDSSGYLTEDQVQKGSAGGAEFSCNCGWIDWSHAQAGLTIGLIEKLRYARSHNYLDAIINPIYGYLSSDKYRNIASDKWGISVSINVGRSIEILDQQVGVSISLFDRMAIVPDSSIKKVIPSILAMSIYMDAQEQFEANQGTTRWGMIAPRLTASSFSEEDLTSDFIGFYMGMLSQDFNLGFESEIRPRIRKMCNVVDPKDSLKVWKESYDSGGKVIKGWRNWYPRFIPLTDKNGCDLGICKSRQWPNTFSMLTSQRVYPQTNGDWWWYSRPSRYEPRIPLFLTERNGLFVMPNTIDLSR